MTSLILLRTMLGSLPADSISTHSGDTASSVSGLSSIPSTRSSTLVASALTTYGSKSLLLLEPLCERLEYHLTMITPGMGEAAGACFIQLNLLGQPLPTPEAPKSRQKFKSQASHYGPCKALRSSTGLVCIPSVHLNPPHACIS